MVVLDADMPRLDRLATLKQIVERQLPVEVLFLTMHDGEDLFSAAFGLGAKGYILKQSAVTEIVAGIRTVAGGQPYCSAALTKYFLNRNRHTYNPVGVANPLDRLTPSEHRIFDMVAGGKSSKEIASELAIHYKTVENHRTQICEKLGLQGPNSLIRYASRNK